MEASSDDPVICERIERIHPWINETNIAFKAGVDAVQEAVARGEVDGLLSLLLTESGVSILTASPSMRDFGEDPDPDSDKGNRFRA